MNLSDKIELLIKKKQMSSSQFADVLGIPRSSISHILSGRNKPSLDVVQKILTAFPEVSAEDLLFEDRTLLVSGAKLSSPSSSQEVLPLVNLFNAPPIDRVASESIKNISTESTIVRSNLRRSAKESHLTQAPNTMSQESVLENNLIQSRSLHKKIDRVIIFYSDGTFTESKPSD
jgi:transcriptional regulator with XRE-family HTH domain